MKEKYEGDLKKEIKKLQRFRDQIKSWAASNDIKNKKPLLDARKAIEQEMERFKVLEKETKTKAYSKEGLSSGKSGRGRSGSMNDDDLDPREDPAKRETFVWLDDLEEKLQSQLEEMEEKMEGYKATSKKKKSSAATNDALMDDLQHKMDRHNHHIERIQLIKDRLEHGELDVALVEDIHDDLDYYVASYSEADFQEDDAMYDALELDKEINRDAEDEEGDDETIATTGETEQDDTTEQIADGDEVDEDDDAGAAGTVSAILKSAGAKSSKSAPKPSSSPSPATTAKGRSNPTPAVPTPVAAPIPVPTSKGDTLASIIAKTQKVSTPTPTTPVNASINATKPSPAKNIPPTATIAGIPTSAAPKPTGTLPTIAPAQLGRLPPSAAAKGSMMPPPGLSSQTPPPGLSTGVSGNVGSTAELSGLPSTSLSGAANAFAVKDRSLVPDDYMLTLNLLEPSLRNLPDPADSERPKQYVPRNPYRTPSYFPSVPAPIFDDPLLFDKLSVDTLFFIFYFQQGTPHQYLAARELKKQSWRYHKNFLTWFQRHDDPKITTEEFEQGTYIYFDYESGWCQRIKADFTFEYRHLEGRPEKSTRKEKAMVRRKGVSTLLIRVFISLSSSLLLSLC